MTDLTVARTILEQLGGRQFMAMTGAGDERKGRPLIGTENSLSFRLPSNFAKDGINHVKIELTPLDEYDVTFTRIRGTKVTEVSKHTGAHAEDLQGLFLSNTGLDTKLFSEVR